MNDDDERLAINGTIKNKINNQVLEYMDRGSLSDLFESHHRRGGGGSPFSSPVASKVRNYNHDDNDEPLDNQSDDNRSSRMPERATAAIAYQALWGLAYLHHENALHRDVKVRKGYR